MHFQIQTKRLRTATSQSYYRNATSGVRSTTYYIPTSLRKVTVTGGDILSDLDVYGYTRNNIIFKVSHPDHDAFYEISTNKMIPIKMPDKEELSMFKHFIERFRKYNPEETAFPINPSKCRHCIYCNLCDKTTENNVYQ